MIRFLKAKYKALNHVFSLMSETQIKRVYGASQVIYALSASSLVYMVYLAYQDNKLTQELTDKNPVYGRPIIKDHNDNFRRLRESGVETSVVLKYDKEKGFIKVPYNRKEYLEQLEEEALERIRVAQRDWIERHGELPPNAIKLVEK